MGEERFNFSRQESYRLLRSAQSGDPEATERLCTVYLPRLRRWAHGRLPRGARSLLETDDLVQDVLRKTVQQLPQFEYRQLGAFQGYLREALRNRLRDEVRRLARGPLAKTFEEKPSLASSPLEELIGRQTLERFEGALALLRPAEREAIVARIELGLTYPQIAEHLGKPSADAARMAVTRALAHLLQEMSKLK